MMRVLLIEDDLSTAKSVQLSLLVQDIKCTICHTGYEGVTQATNSQYDIILLDMILPDLDGTEVIYKLRQNKVQTPILILSAITHPDQKIKALKLGADDYMTKPFNNTELIARIKAIVKRANKDIKSIAHIGKVTIDFNLKTVKVLDKHIHLTDKEYAIVELLALKRTGFSTKEHIMEYLYGNINQAPIKIINVFICRVRKKLEKASGGYNFIQTVWGSGYRLLEEGEKLGARQELFAKPMLLTEKRSPTKKATRKKK
jgi:two-component system, cell cycle response regulator CtrA